jgi:hypothetical protein
MEETPALQSAGDSARTPTSYPALLWANIKTRKSEFFGGLLLSVASSTASVWLQYRDGMLDQKHFWDGVITTVVPVLAIVVIFALIEVYRAAASLHREAQGQIGNLIQKERKCDPVPYLAVDYVTEWQGFVDANTEEEYSELVEFLKFTNASGEVIRRIRVEPFTIWGVELSAEPVSTLVPHSEPVKRQIRGIERQLQKANLGLRAFHKAPVGVCFTVSYHGQRDDKLPYSTTQALIYEKGNIRVEPLIGDTGGDWLDASEVVEGQDETEGEDTHS